MKSPNIVKSPGMTPEEERVVKSMRELGFDPKKIAECREKRTCDFSAGHGGDSYLIEAKMRAEDEEVLSAMRSGNWAVKRRSQGHSNPISKIVRDSVNQLDSVITDSATYRLIWISLVYFPDEELGYKQILYTLYGIEDIIFQRLDDQQKKCGQCFYFTHSEFHRFPQLDAAIVERRAGFTLCLNESSRNHDRFHQSVLVRQFRERKGAVTPKERERGNNCLLVEGDLDRSEPKVVLEHVRSKYKLTSAANVTVQQSEIYFPMQLPKEQ